VADQPAGNSPPDPPADPPEIDDPTKASLQVAIRETLDTELRRFGINIPLQKEQAVAERVTSVAVREISASFQGPIPPPPMLRAYDDAVPGLAKQIADAAHLEQQHRHRWERRALWNDIFCQSGGMFLGWVLAVGCAVGAFLLAQQGNNWGAGILLSVTVGAVVRTIVHNGGRKQPPTQNEKPASRVPAKSGRHKRR
jgi:uncharacterized membrane protein